MSYRATIEDHVANAASQMLRIIESRILFSPEGCDFASESELSLRAWLRELVQP